MSRTVNWFILESIQGSVTAGVYEGITDVRHGSQESDRRPPWTKGFRETVSTEPRLKVGGISVLGPREIAPTPTQRLPSGDP